MCACVLACVHSYAWAGIQAAVRASRRTYMRACVRACVRAQGQRQAWRGGRAERGGRAPADGGANRADSADLLKALCHNSNKREPRLACVPVQTHASWLRNSSSHGCLMAFAARCTTTRPGTHGKCVLFVLFDLQLSMCLWWHDYRSVCFPTLKKGGNRRPARHLSREGPFALGSAPTIWAGEPGRCWPTTTRGASSGLVLKPCAACLPFRACLRGRLNGQYRELQRFSPQS